MDQKCEAGVLESNSDIFCQQILMNVPTKLIAVIPMHHVLISREVSFVRATLVILVMEQAAQVYLLYLLMIKVSSISTAAYFKIKVSFSFYFNYYL